MTTETQKKYNQSKITFKKILWDTLLGLIGAFKNLIILMLYVPLLFGAGASLYILLKEYPETGLVFFNSMFEVLGFLDNVGVILIIIFVLLLIVLIFIQFIWRNK